MALPALRDGQSLSLETDQRLDKKFKPGLGYLPFLDGFRAVAIFYVLCFHNMGPISSAVGGSCGWVGVDIFFVISGFLMTCLLRQEYLITGRVNVKQYIFRRILRIAPAYYAFLGFLAIKHFNQPTFLQSEIVAAVYMTDYDSAFKWGNTARTNLGHTWSLAVEEKFYILYPVFISLFGRRLLPTLTFLLIAAEIWKAHQILNGADWVRLHFAFDTHVDSILVGCIAGVLWINEKSNRWIRRLLSREWLITFFVFAALASTQCIGSNYSNQPSNNTLYWIFRLPLHSILIACTILALTSRPDCVYAKALSMRALVFCGKLSYSLYLWHSFVFEFVNAKIATHVENPLAVECIKLTAALLTAAASFYLIEKPFLRLKKTFEPKEFRPAANLFSMRH